MEFREMIGQSLCFMFITVWVAGLIVFQLVRAVDDDGEIKKSANNGLATWIEKLFKSK